MGYKGLPEKACVECEDLFKPLYKDSLLCKRCIKQYTCAKCGLVVAPQYGYTLGGNLNEGICSWCSGAQGDQEVNYSPSSTVWPIQASLPRTMRNEIYSIAQYAGVE